MSIISQFKYVHVDLNITFCRASSIITHIYSLLSFCANLVKDIHIQNSLTRSPRREPVCTVWNQQLPWKFHLFVFKGNLKQTNVKLFLKDKQENRLTYVKRSLQFKSYVNLLLIPLPRTILAAPAVCSYLVLTDISFFNIISL